MGTSIALTLGGSPAPGWLMSQLREVEVTQSDEAPNGFQVTFSAVKTAAQTADYAALSYSGLQAGGRLAVSATVGQASAVLIDGYITHIQYQPGTPTEEARIVVTGEDVSFKMAAFEYSVEYPMMSDFMIAGLVLAKWLVLGITPSIHPTPSSWLNFANVPQQVGNDRDYLRALAAQHGYVFYIRPGAAPGDNTAYWGPPPRDAAPQPALTVDAGGASTVSEIHFTFDYTQPQFVWGAVLNTTTNLVVPIKTFMSTRTGTFATNPALQVTDLNIRNTLFDHQGLGVVTAMGRGQAITDVSTDQVVVAEGKLDALRYGNILTAPGVVALRGSGQSHDGYYYVKKVTHRATPDGYEQEFTLTREGLGSTIANVGAAP